MIVRQHHGIQRRARRAQIVRRDRAGVDVGIFAAAIHERRVALGNEQHALPLPHIERDNVQPALFIVQGIDLCRGEERQDGKPHRRKITVLPALCQRAGDEDRVHVRKPCDGKRGVEIDGVERKLLQKSCDGKHRANAERRHKGTGRAELRHSRRDQYRK